MTPPTNLAHKGDLVEEWIDLKFFRPVGGWIAAALRPTSVSADQVTLLALAIGLIGANLFYYASASLNWTGLALLIVSDILDSSDGQLARLRGNSSRWGRILDGISDNARFVALYLHLAARLVVSGTMPAALAIGAILMAGVSHSAQAAAADFLRQAFLWLRGDKSELDLPEDLGRTTPRTWWDRIGLWNYRGYLRRQVLLCPFTAATVRAERARREPGRLADRWTTAQHKWIQRLAWIGTNVRFPLLAGLIVAADPMWFLWATIGPLNLLLAWIVLNHERNARLAATVAPAADLTAVSGAA